MTRTHTRRGGFTLIELMVVIALIVTLAALSAGAFYKIQAAQRAGATEATVRKVQIVMDARWKAVLDDSRRSVPDAVVTLAGGDKERALSIWTYAKLKNEFPQTFAEVAPIQLPTTPVIILQPRQVFVAAVKSGTTEPDWQRESAALLYAALTATGSGGTGGELDGLNQQVGTTPGGRQTFVDNWGTPIAFVRWAGPPEVQGEPFARENVVQTRFGTFTTENPLDPTGKLLPQAPPPAGNPANTWANLPVRGELMAKLGVDFTTANFVPTLISAGSDKAFTAPPSPSIPAPPLNDVFGGTGASDEAQDNIVGYRLRREGAQGN